MASGRIEQRKHAIVIGGSMAGLLAARVLSDHYEHVTIFERDTFPQSHDNRRGVPQGKHTHGLLASGAQVMGRLFPGLLDELIADGAVPGDVIQRGSWCFEGGQHAKFASGFEGMLMSRPFLEGHIRSRLLALPNITARQDCCVEGLRASEDRRRITGVQLPGGSMDADLAVDTTGRGSHSPRWLEQFGYQRPREDKVEASLAYTTRLFRRSASHLSGDIVVIIPPTPSGKRGGVMLAQEGGRWTVTLIQYFGSGVPSDVSGFIDFASTLPAPHIHEVIRHAEPIGDAVSARFPGSIWRRYDKLEQFPMGYLVFGDAISSFNPIYGQGMSVAALEAAELETSLVGNSDGLAKRFFAQAAKLIAIPWSIAAGSDLRIPETAGKRTTQVRFINWYIAKLHKAAHSNPAAVAAFHRVTNLLAPPPSIMHPRIAMQILMTNLR